MSIAYDTQSIKLNAADCSSLAAGISFDVDSITSQIDGKCEGPMKQESVALAEKTAECFAQCKEFVDLAASFFSRMADELWAMDHDIAQQMKEK